MQQISPWWFDALGLLSIVPRRAQVRPDDNDSMTKDVHTPVLISLPELKQSENKVIYN